MMRPVVALPPIGDVDAAYANGAAVPGSQAFAPRWAALAEAFRAQMLAAGRARLDLAYGSAPRERFDLFEPAGTAAGTLVFVHGGYWKAFDKSAWSHLAAGALARGWRVAMPSYTLCPAERIGGIVAEIGRCLDRLAEDVPGPLRLCGHSAGGHLVARMVAGPAPVAAATLARIERVVPISGVHDLRPLLATAMNAVLGLDEAEALRESPALLRPLANVPVRAVVGADELPAFRSQTALLAAAWHGLGARIGAAEIDGRHHFDIVDDLAVPGSALLGAILGAAEPQA